jgi:outer membrane immunogenic protein
MHRLLVALCLTGLLSPAFAADLDVLRGSEEVPALAVGNPTFTRWSGFYFGGDVSYNYSQADFSRATQPLLAFSLRDTTLEQEVTPSSIPILGKGGIDAFGGGGFLGYNTQWQDLIVGVEATYAHANLNTTASSSPIGRIFPSVNNQVLLNANGNLDLTDYASARFRAGYVVGNLLPYGFIGFVVGRASYNVSTTADVTQSTSTTSTPDYSCAGTRTATPTCQDFFFSNSAGRSNAFLYGGSIGAGLDWAITSHFFLRGEFEYILFTPLSSIDVSIINARVGAGFKF